MLSAARHILQVTESLQGCKRGGSPSRGCTEMHQQTRRKAAAWPSCTHPAPALHPWEPRGQEAPAQRWGQAGDDD